MNRQERMVRFQANICEECRICNNFKDDNFEPEFCFEKFENDAAIFIEDVFPKLALVAANIGRKGVQESDMTYAFCDTGVCYIGDMSIAKSCTRIDSCLNKFQQQANTMSKKKHKRSSNKKIYSEKQFLNIVCNKCGICPSWTDPEFCYHDVYKHDPTRFMEVMFSRLIQLRKKFKSEARHISAITKPEFLETICKAKVCFNTNEDCEDCYKNSDCYDTFVDQSCGILVTQREEETKKGKKKKKESYIPVPYATFFSSTKKGFQEEIQRILYGNKNSKQDTNKEMPGEFAAEINSGSQNGESEVSGSAE